MYESFYGFKEKPFQIIPDPNMLYLSPNHDHALKYLEYGIERNIGIFLLTGEVGSGKTTLLQHLCQGIDQSFEVAYISNTNLSADQLLNYVLLELNIQPDDNGKAQNLQIFKAFLKSLSENNRRVLLIFDEAQNLPKDALEEIRMLSNFQADSSMPLQIFLVGQPELRTILKSPGMVQIRQRIAVNYHLNALNLEETRKYIEYRLVRAGATANPFNTEAVDLIFKATSGIPRSINLLCDSSLLYGFAEEEEIIDGRVVREVVSELNLDSFVTNDTRSFDPPDNLPPRHEAVNVASLPEKTDIQGAWFKKVLVMLNKKIDRVDIKLDLLRKDILNIIGDAARTERVSYGDLMVESAKIHSEYERLKSELRDAHTNGDGDKPSGYQNSARDREKSAGEGKVYKLEK